MRGELNFTVRQLFFLDFQTDSSISSVGAVLPPPSVVFPSTSTVVNTIEPIKVTRLGDILLFAVHNNPCIGISNPSNIADNSSCNHFISCTNTRSVRYRCPGNLFYDPEINACNWPDKVDCVDGVRPPPTTVSTTSQVALNTTTESISSTVSTNVTTSIQIPLNICNGIKLGRHVIDPDFCTHFYTCTNVGPVRKVCPPRTIFNREAQVCDNPSNVDCQNGKRPNVTVTTAVPIALSSSTEFPLDPFAICKNATDSPTSTGLGNTGLAPHPLSCTLFFMCVDGGVTMRFNCTMGTFFNNKQKQCVAGGPDSCRPTP